MKNIKQTRNKKSERKMRKTYLSLCIFHTVDSVLCSLN